MPDEGVGWCLLSFNLGVEIGQVIICALAYPLMLDIRTACVRFEPATVKLATPGLGAEQLCGQFRRIRLSSLQGQLEIGQDDALAFPPVVGVYVRRAQ